MILAPPSTITVEPAINEEFEPLKKSATLATSSGSQIRPSSLELLTRSMTSLEADINIGVFVGPGAMQLTRVPRGANSRAKRRVRPSMADFVEA